MKRTKQEADQTKQLILNAALDVFSVKSYDTATLNDIAKRANVTRGAIYWHFEDKISILKELTDIHLTVFLNILNQEFSFSGETSLEKIKKLFKLYFEYFLDNESNLKFKRILDTKIGFNDVNCFAQEIMGEIFEKMVNDINTVIILGQKNGEIRNDLEASFLTGTLMVWIIELDKLYILTKEFNFLERREDVLKNIIKMLSPS